LQISDEEEQPIVREQEAALARDNGTIKMLMRRARKVADDAVQGYFALVAAHSIKCDKSFIIDMLVSKCDARSFTVAAV
jgi:hypothetical protein